MRHRAEQRRLERVAPSQRLCFERLALEPAALDDDGQQGRERRQEPAPHGVVHGRLLVHEEGGDAAEPGLDRQRPLARLRRLLAEIEAELVDAEDAAREGREPAELLVEGPAAQQVQRGLGESMRLGSPLFGVLPPRPGPRRERAHRERDGEVDGEREPVLALPQVERVVRRQEEPVERQHARHGDDSGKRRAPDDRNRQHGEDVERSEAERRHVRLEQLDDAAHGRDRTRAREDAEQ